MKLKSSYFKKKKIFFFKEFEPTRPKPKTVLLHHVNHYATHNMHLVYFNCTVNIACRITITNVEFYPKIFCIAICVHEKSNIASFFVKFD